jgi:methyltransferase-like protein
MPDWYVFHEFLEEHNTPLYFDHFVELAKGHGLRYLADSDLSTQIESPTSSSLRDVIATISTDSSKETQYADYLNLRLLRRALLVQEEAKVLDSPDPTRLTKLFIASPAIAKNEQPSIASDTPEAFVVEKRGSMAFTSAIAKAAFCHLSAIWPEGIKFEELHEAAIQLLPGESIGDLAIRTELSQAITDAFMCGAVNLDPLKPKAIKNPGAKPKVCPFVLAEARRSMRVTGARHQYLVLDGFAKLLIKLLDGTHSADDCFRKLKDAQVEIYDEERRRTRMMSLSRLEHAQFHEWYSLVIEEFSRRGLFVE